MLHAISSLGSLFDAYALLREEQAANTEAGTFTSGAWQTRTLNTESFDPDGIVSLSANQFTLLSGNYFVFARAPAVGVVRHKAKIRNVTAGSDALIGASAHAALTPVYTESLVTGRIAVASATAFELQHRCQTTAATNGFGTASNFAVVEVYSEVLICREA